MLVFRCECDHVLGVESESSQGQAGECPSCGRIIRVPDSLVNGKGRLRLAVAPSRATPSGAFRQLKNPADSALSIPFPVPKPANLPVSGEEPSTIIDSRGLSSFAEPETLAPLTEKEVAMAGVETEMLPPPVDKPPPAAPLKDETVDLKRPKSSRANWKPKSTSDTAAESAPAPENALAGAGSAVSSMKRRKPEAAPAKKSPVLLFAIIALVIALAAGISYALGFFDKPAPENKTPPPPTNTKPDDKKPDAPKPDAPKPDDKKPDADKPDANKAN